MNLVFLARHKKFARAKFFLQILISVKPMILLFASGSNKNIVTKYEGAC